jgi:stage II sporulation protein D
MKRLALALVSLVATSLSARAVNPELRVELFSGKMVKSLTITAKQSSVNLCGLKTDGPCKLLKAGQNVVCYADRRVRCRMPWATWNFTQLTVTANGLFLLTPSLAGAKESPHLAPNARVHVKGAGLGVVTQVDLESYASGVLIGEASILHAPAAREAMAILARTWALRWQGRHRSQGFDFCSLTHCLVFRLPRAAEPGAALDPDKAILATRGQVLKYHGALADPYFTACCGGMTESAGNVWPDRAQPYLIAVRDPYCLASEHASWKREISRENVEQVLRTALHLPLAAPFSELSVEKQDSSGRALILRVVAGSEWRVDANEFRYALDRGLGWGQIESNLYTIRPGADAWIFSGHGLGHGVGLCQAGAEQMARMGFSAARILSTYFPGAEICFQAPPNPDPIASSEHFELVYPASQEPWVKQALGALEQWRKELGPHAEALPPRVRVQTWATTEEFIHATGQPGWMAGASDGQSVALEPLALLARKGILDQTLRHELTHLIVHRLGAKGVPRWFEEGMVLYVTAERIAPPPATRVTEQGLEEAISRPRSEAEMKAAYAQALEKVRQYARRQGDAALWRVLERPTTDDLHWLHGIR